MGQAQGHLDMQAEVADLVGDVGLLESQVETESGVVHQHVDAFGQAGLHRRTLVVVEEVGDQHVGARPEVGADAVGDDGQCRAIARDQHHIGSAGGELPGELGAEARARTGDEGRAGHSRPSRA